MPLSNHQPIVHILLHFLEEWKQILLYQLARFQSKFTFWVVKERLFLLNCAVNECECAAIIYLDTHQFQRLSLTVP